MLKKILGLTLLIAIFIPAAALAADRTINLNNYYYTISNQADTGIYLADKYLNKTIYGDAAQNDAYIQKIVFQWSGLGSEKLYVEYDDGTKERVNTPTFTLSKSTKSVSIYLDKTTTNETWVAVSQLYVYDESEGGLNIEYTYQTNTPYQPGDLGNGSSPSPTPTPVPTPTPKPTASPTPTPSSSSAMKVSYSSTSRKITWTNLPADTYEVIVTDPSGQKTHVAPNGLSNFYVVSEGKGGVYKVQAVNLAGNVLDTKTVTVTFEEPTPSGDPGNAVDLDFNVNTKVLSWSGTGSASKVKVFKDGQLLGMFTNGETSMQLGDDYPGSYAVYALSDSGQILGSGTMGLYAPGGDTGGGDDGGGSGGCDACDNLKNLLSCPDWAVVMGDVTNAIKNALPPPPNWPQIADMIGGATVDHLASYLGDVPEPPSDGQIKFELDTPKPPLDTSVETDDLRPSVAPEFNSGKIVFDLNNTPDIAVKDESKPFRIDDPIANQKHDDPGVAVIPGDTRNNSDGIKNPDHPDTGNNAPKPTTGNTAPSDPAPVPSNSGGSAPSPNLPGGGTAIPDPTTGIIPIPKGGGG